MEKASKITLLSLVLAVTINIYAQEQKGEPESKLVQFHMALLKRGPNWSSTAATIEEAPQLAETDPAVQAGRLKLEIHPFIVPGGILPD
jgi:hypothetical protein